MNAITLTTRDADAIDLVVFVGDMHINATRGLRVPQFTDRDDKTYIAPDTIRTELWEPWCQHWQDVAAEKQRLSQHYKQVRVFVILGGDSTDRNAHDQEGYELWLMEIHSIIDLAERTLAPALVKMPDGRPLVDRWIVLRGTEAHELRLGQLAEGLGERLALRGCEVHKRDNLFSYYEFRGLFQGVNVYASHHPLAKSYRHHTRAQAVTRTVVDYWLGYCSPLILFNETKIIGPVDHPDLMFFFHAHFDAESGKVPGCPIKGYYVASWQLPYAYIFRLGKGSPPEHVGSRWLWCSDGKWHCEPWLHSPGRLGAEVM
jgi:hypothetical protein